MAYWGLEYIGTWKTEIRISTDCKHGQKIGLLREGGREEGRKKGRKVGRKGKER